MSDAHHVIKAMMGVEMNVVGSDGRVTVIRLSEQDARRVLRKALGAAGIDDRNVRKVGVWALVRAAYPGGWGGADTRRTPSGSEEAG